MTTAAADVVLLYSIAGAFLIPYFLAIFLVILPATYLEMVIGHLTQRGPIRSWDKLASAFKGRQHYYWQIVKIDLKISSAQTEMGLHPTESTSK